MFGKTTVLVGAAAGYVLGTRAGRERYDQIVDQANKLWGNPKVQDTVSGAQDAVKKQASAVKKKAGSSDSDTSDSEQTAATEPPSPASVHSPAEPKPGAPAHG